MKGKIIMIGLCIMLLMGCSTSKGELSFYANGEAFAQDGLVSKDGWKLSFDHVYVNLSDITAYQTKSPYDASTHQAIKSHVAIHLDGVHTVDLAKGSEPILVGTTKASKGIYNAISFKVIEDQKNHKGAMILIGKASKNDKTMDFYMEFEKEFEYFAGEYIGETRKGILDDEKADLEMTFHLDHLFGNGDLSLNDGVNQEAIGFNRFAKLSKDGKIHVDLKDLRKKMSKEDYDNILNILPTLGHVGEGHAYAKEL